VVPAEVAYTTWKLVESTSGNPKFWLKTFKSAIAFGA
jgi:hypothetical protein